jgi:ABC-type uncharacterized transport system substrate-binding protein
MRRRDLVAGAAIPAALGVAAPLRALAQTPSPRRRIALVHSGIPADQLTEASPTFWVRRFFAELRARGYAEGSNLTVYRYSAEGRPERYAGLANDVAANRPDLIITNQNSLVKAIGRATPTIPIVAIIGDPVGSGLVASLAHPGGNITGVSVDAGVEIYGKRLQILKEAFPTIDTIAYLALPAEWHGAIGQAMLAVGKELGISILSATPSEATGDSLHAAVAEAIRRGSNAVIVGGSGDFLAHRQLIVDLVNRGRLAAIYPYRDYAEVGGLIAYAPELGDLARHLADNVDRILRGASPGNLPIYQASKFELVVNLKTAGELGLTVPQSLLARADEVIE